MTSPHFDDDDDDIHIGDVFPTSDDDDDPIVGGRCDRLASTAAYGGHHNYGGGRRRRRRPGGGGEEWEDDDEGDGDERGATLSCDPAAAHVREGSIFLPVEMTLPEKEGGGRGDDAAAPPSFSVDQARVSLYAAFPSPPVVLRPYDDDGAYDEADLDRARKRLERHSGFHGGVGVTSATQRSEGYSDAILSLNYRQPSLISLPSFSPLLFGRVHSQRRQRWVRDDRCNLHLGSDPKISIGSTLSALDGRAGLGWDVGNPFYHLTSPRNRTINGRLGSPSPRSDYTISASRVFLGVGVSDPLRVDWRMKLSPSYSDSETMRLHHFNLKISTLNAYHGKRGRMRGGLNRRPKLSLSLGYGVPTMIGRDGLLPPVCRCVLDAGSHECGVDVGDCDSAMYRRSHVNYSAGLKLDAEHRLSPDRSCLGTIEYRNDAERALSFGAVVTRTFASSGFSRLGFGVRHAFGNIFREGWWRRGSTWWLFRLERGDVRFVVPVTISPSALSARDSLLRLFYSSLASILADVLVGELLCGVTSKLRLDFLRLLLGEERVGEYDDGKEGQNDEERWLRHGMLKAREDAARHVKLMERQARAAAKKEEERGGLVIVRAVYGVMDEESGSWMGRAESGEESSRHATMDATTQLQFWVTDSSLRLPAASKKHMLGFYDVTAFVSEEQWAMRPAQPSEGDEGERGDLDHALFPACRRWLEEKGPWRRPSPVEIGRDGPAVVLSVRYEFDGRTYDVVFGDEEAVELPSQFAKESAAVGKSTG